MIGTGSWSPYGRHMTRAGVPVIVETPTEGHAGHAADIAALKRLRGTSPG